MEKIEDKIREILSAEDSNPEKISKLSSLKYDKSLRDAASWGQLFDETYSNCIQEYKKEQGELFNIKKENIEKRAEWRKDLWKYMVDKLKQQYLEEYKYAA